MKGAAGDVGTLSRDGISATLPVLSRSTYSIDPPHLDLRLIFL
jgi:hypothetical protein